MNSRDGPGRGPILLSVGLHALLIVLLLAGIADQDPLPEFVVYRVSIVSPPPAPVEEATDDPVEETAPEPEPVESLEPEPETTTPRPVPEPPPVQPEETPPEDASPPPPTAEPDPRGEPGGEDLNVDLTGEEFPYPGYLENIIRQVHRYFRWSGNTRPVAGVYFMILRDGSVEDIRILRSSGNPRFDLEAMGAIEQAGRRGAFGALPAEFQGERLPVYFDFRPPR